MKIIFVLCMNHAYGGEDEDGEEVEEEEWGIILELFHVAVEIYARALWITINK